MENYVQANEFELWLIIENGPLVLTKTNSGGISNPKVSSDEFDYNDMNKMKKNVRDKKLLYFSLGPNEYNHISECASTKDIWNSLKVAHECRNQVK